MAMTLLLPRSTARPRRGEVARRGDFDLEPLLRRMTRGPTCSVAWWWAIYSYTHTYTHIHIRKHRLDWPTTEVLRNSSCVLVLVASHRPTRPYIPTKRHTAMGAPTHIHTYTHSGTQSKNQVVRSFAPVRAQFIVEMDASPSIVEEENVVIHAHTQLRTPARPPPIKGAYKHENRQRKGRV